MAEHIGANNVRERGEGLADLKHVLRHNQRNSSIDSLDDGTYLHIFQALFKLVINEKPTHANAKTAALKSGAANRLSSCANAIRLAVEVGVASLRLKTVKALLDHFIDTIPLSDGDVCEPLALDYPKAMRTVLAHQPHVAHLPKAEWKRAVAFCLEHSQTAQSEAHGGLSSLGVNATFTSSRSSRSRLNHSMGSQPVRGPAKQVAEEMVACLRLLTSAPNAPVPSMASDILWSMIRFLQGNTSSNPAHQDAFATISNTLAWTKTENIRLTREVTSQTIRLIRGYWTSKSGGLKEMLTALMHLQLFIQDRCNDNEDESFRVDLKALLDTLQSEYSKRLERDQLHLDDIRFGSQTVVCRQPGLIKYGIMSLQCVGIRAEQTWTTVHMMASVVSLLHAACKDSVSDDELEEGSHERPRKRQRVTNELDELVSSASKGTVTSRITALQILTFWVQQSALTPAQLNTALGALLICCSEEIPSIASWAFVAVAGCAHQTSSTDDCLKPRWISIWHLACRSVVNASTCRAACGVLCMTLRLQLIPTALVSDLYQSLAAAFELSGPNILCDTAVELAQFAMTHSMAILPSSATTIASSVMGWLLRRWLPSKFDDRSYAASCKIFNNTDVVCLISQLLGHASHLSGGAGFPIWDVLGRACLHVQENDRLVSYLLSISEPQSFVHPSDVLAPVRSTVTLVPKPSSGAMLMSHLITEMTRATEIWKQLIHDRPQGISSDVFSALCQFLAASACVAHCVPVLENRHQSQLQQQCRTLSKVVNEYVTNSACGQDKVDIMLACFARNIWPPAENESTTGPEECTESCRYALCHSITEALASRNASQYTDGEVDEEDMMDMGNSYESQESGRRVRQQATAVQLSDDSSITHSAFALRAAIPLYASITTSVIQNGRPGDNDLQNATYSVTDNILALPENDIIASRVILANLPSLVPSLTTSDAERLLEFMTDNLLQDYTFERSEAALGTILDAIIGLERFWTDTSNKNLADLGLDTYEWCVSTALPAGFLSPNVQKKVSTLLLHLCHVNTEYGHDDGAPSVRTSLFDLLRRGAISVQFHLAERISTIFGLFVLSAHNAMFDDLQSSLPVESEWVEGLAMRLLFLAKLASSWHSLLRQSVYYIFETAGRVDISTPYATACVKEVAASLRFESPRKLFRLFAPQLLHTWLEDQSLEALPYAAFGFLSLQDLLADVQAEVTAQLLMNGLDGDMQLMVKALDIDERELLLHSFGKSVAYAISHDIVRPSSDQSSNCEPRLRNIVGSKEEYKRLSSEHFATIMGHFFISMNQDDVEDSWLGKRPNYGSATKALSDIKAFSYSTRPMPTPQQPSFRSRYLLDQMERFCRRTGQDPAAPWESSTFAVAARMMFDTLDTALGSLHNCTVLRKLRVLIATAGEVAVTGYPLEMLLRGVRPYLTDNQCADDALGIVKYLIRRGRRQLSSNTRFMCGMLTIILLETRAHTGTKQDSTTQETQHRETVQRMQSFYAFGVEFLRESRHAIGGPMMAEYDELTGALSRLQLPGNARKGSPESTLLLLLVRQRGTGQSLFVVSDVEAALVILTQSFKAPHSIAEDALTDDDACVALAPSLWRTIHNSNYDSEFILWVGKAIGRAYAASGRHYAYTNDGTSKIRQAPQSNFTGPCLPYALIVRRLCEMVISPIRSDSGLAEYVLRTVALVLPQDTDEEMAFKESLPESLAPSILRGTYGYTPPTMPKFILATSDRQMLKAALESDDSTELSDWVVKVALVLCRWPKAPSLLAALPTVFISSPQLAMDVFPAMVHMMLDTEVEDQEDLRPELSAAIKKYLDDKAKIAGPKQDYLLTLMLYLRRQPYPKEYTKVDRLRWLDIDYMRAADTAARRAKPTFALMLAESSASPVQVNRRASSRASSAQPLPVHVPEDMLLNIFEQIDEPDSFYGVEQPASLESVLGRLDYEDAGFKSLMFRSAQVDSHMRQSNELGSVDALGMVRSLSSLNLNSLTYALTSGQVGNSAVAATEEMLESARRLQKWDIALPESKTDGSSRVLSVYQELHRAVKFDAAMSSLDNLALQHLRAAQQVYTASRPSRAWFSCLALIAETTELVSSTKGNELSSTWARLQDRETWMTKARFDDFDMLQQGRITAFSVIGRNESLLKDLHATRNTMRISEAQALLSYSSLARQHSQLQVALCAATQVNDLAQELKATGIYVDAAAKHEVASVLWDSQETTTSVKMLRDTIRSSDLDKQQISVGRSGLLAQLGKQLADARLEKPSDILENYLRPAISYLPKNAVGKEAGRVYHAFAAFCDQQLQHPANVEDYNRISTLRQRKLEEVQELQAMSSKVPKRADDKRSHEVTLKKAQQWFKLDDAEFQHQRQSRETFVQQSLQNYLLALHASDEHDLSVLRFFALWLESSESASANTVIKEHLPKVPSWKFVVLLNQLMSRLQSEKSTFQASLTALIKRLCLNHPYHSVHHLYASSRTPKTREEATRTRYSAAHNIRQELSHDPAQGDLFKKLNAADGYYRVLAEEPLSDKRLGKMPLKDIGSAVKVSRRVPELEVPPVTIDLPLQPDGVYKDIPVVTHFLPFVSIMSGLSSPKVLTAVSSTGQQYKQLFKSGNDDLRQDAIMEQVFEEVSKMLQNHKATRQRNLHIRTYKVIPLTANSGIIEFVPNSIPINEFLTPAHQLYNPSDMKNSTAREKIRNVQGHSTETRVKEFRKVCDHLQPVMRHFFLERFDDPDDWFEKRTAYTRTTASVSMLGHVLGLGDRHGHNIMLDEVTGEVVHIDLGVAFEAGRVLPVPELVPFRLTRDIVDGMGVNKTEGIFRRCCEFTMDALREDKDSIMTLLNVLRYDPLVTWTLSPLRAKRMQDAQDGIHNAKDVEAAESSKAKIESEGGEADRALAVVEKKLSKTLSTAATVNELIQQATDERNLATLFGGWAAWF